MLFRRTLFTGIRGSTTYLNIGVYEDRKLANSGGFTVSQEKFSFYKGTHCKILKMGSTPYGMDIFIDRLLVNLPSGATK